MSNLEIETTLAICSVAPESIATEVANLAAIGPYMLRPEPDLAIRDEYLDLTNHALRAHGFGLRIRRVDGSQLITLKGRAQEVVGGGRSREEVELAWSEDALNSMVERVAEVGLVLVPPRDVLEWDDPLAVLSQMGFVADHSRETIRRPRNVIVEGEPHSILAELVVDSVSFHFHFGKVRHHEVEVETKGEGGVIVMQDISEGLLLRWPRALRAWDHGKRSTGKAVEALIAEQGTKGLITKTGDLVPEAYDLIASYLC